MPLRRHLASRSESSPSLPKFLTAISKLVGKSPLAMLGAIIDTMSEMGMRVTVTIPSRPRNGRASREATPHAPARSPLDRKARQPWLRELRARNRRGGLLHAEHMVGGRRLAPCGQHDRDPRSVEPSQSGGMTITPAGPSNSTLRLASDTATFDKRWITCVVVVETAKVGGTTSSARPNSVDVHSPSPQSSADSPKLSGSMP